MDKVDFVVLWVDGDDPEWQKVRAQYSAAEKKDSMNSAVRYRDWGLMKYWFRGVECFAPWVNHVYFVTWGHYPQWLNIEHPKLTIVRHEDFIPEEYLPTFNSNVIELNMHRIESLSEKFVLFNDDIFLTNHVSERDFFSKRLPREAATLGQLSPIEEGPFTHSILNVIRVINQNFNKKEVLRKNWKKFYSLKYGKYLFQNIVLSGGPYFSNFKDTHLCTSYLKSNFGEVVEKLETEIDKTCRSKFRSNDDVTHWLIKYWQMCCGKFIPRSYEWGRKFTLGVDTDWEDAVCKQKYKVVCLNDAEDLDFKKVQKQAVIAFESILPNKSSFEK